MSEVGIIGQMYEDRRTKKTGKLLERDDKYKTVMLESPDGKTFSVSFSGFKSNWRTVEAEDILVTSMAEIELVDDKVKKPTIAEKQKTIQDLSRSDAAVKFYGDFVEQIVKFVDKLDTPHVTLASSIQKCSISVKVNNRRIFETYSKYRKNVYNTLIPIHLISEYPELKKFGDIHAYLENSPNRDNVCLHLKPENVNEFLDVIYKCILNILEDHLNKED